jgi:hypothetical protein
LAGQPIQIWNKNTKRGLLVNDLDSLKHELWNTILAKRKEKHPKTNYGTGTQNTIIIFWIESEKNTKHTFVGIGRDG